MKKLIALNNPRDPNLDRQKKKVIKRTCKVDECTNNISHYHGPGSQTLCREHQITLREYGGFARTDRVWTFHKKDICEDCGHDPLNNIRVQGMPLKEKKVYAMRLLQVDHVVVSNPKNNHPSNLRTLCGDCHAMKTYLNGDF